jgi:hypothetical protein
MAKKLSFWFCCFFMLSALYGQSPASFLPELDSAVRVLAADIQKRLPPSQHNGDQKIIIGQWGFRDSVTALGTYWAFQLAEELTNIPDRSFTLVSSGNADLVISGEIIEVAGNLRIYTRLIFSDAQIVAVSLHSDFQSTEALVQMLASTGGAHTPIVLQDGYETDSMENPVLKEIGADADSPVIRRTLHSQNDMDYFLLLPDRDGRLVMETTGDMDTVMEFFGPESENSLASDDDDGFDANAKIRHPVYGGGRYIAKVRGYSGATGSYGFRAYLVEEAVVSRDEYENDDNFSSAREIAIGISQTHTFHTGSDTDWVKFEVRQSGRYTVTVRGLNNLLDPYIELYDAAQNSIDENDDGGESLDSRLTLSLDPGTYYLRVKCYDDEPAEPYTITIQADGPVAL